MGQQQDRTGRSRAGLLADGNNPLERGKQNTEEKGICKSNVLEKVKDEIQSTRKGLTKIGAGMFFLRVAN